MMTSDGVGEKKEWGYFETSPIQRKIPVAVLGATGSVGQRIVELLARHPWFEIVQLVASDRSAGKSYAEATNWLLPTPIPEKIREMKITLSERQSDARMAFSALDAHVAGSVETAWAELGVAVVTNARSHRMDQFVPLIIPEVNHQHLDLLRFQPYAKGGCIVANPNCATIGLSLAICPLIESFGVEKVSVTTFQSASGAGFPGIPSLSLLDNIIPFISGEEEKVEKEPLKIFSRLEGQDLVAPSMVVSASCARVPVTEGHLASVSVALKKSVSLDDIRLAFEGFSSPLASMGLPSAPCRPIHFFAQMDAPQPKLHRMIERGMAVSVGALRLCPLFDCKFFVLSHNVIRGAAGGSVLTGELLVKQNWVS
jgi:aspartate-semialdehyde dehydrogenase